MLSQKPAFSVTMYLDYEVKIPDYRHEITRKTIRGITYIYYAYDRKYSLDKHYTVPKNTTIGKCLDASAETMYPNTNFLKYFPEAELPETRELLIEVPVSGSELSS